MSTQAAQGISESITPPPDQGKRVFVLSQGAPSLPGVRWDARWRLPVYRGRRLPHALLGHAARLHSLEWLVQDILNGRMPPPPATRERPALRTHQVHPVQLMTKAHASGTPGFLLAYPTGSGKTAMLICATLDLPKVSTVLVVTKLDVIPAWRNAISYFGGGGKRWVVMNPEQLWRLFDHPIWHLNSLSPDQAAVRAAEGGVPRVPFDAVIVDESHMLVSPDAVRSRLVDRLVLPGREGRRAPWFIRASASPFSSPEETGYVSDLLAYAADVKAPGRMSTAEHKDWLRELGFEMNTGHDGRWAHHLSSGDLKHVESLLFSGTVGVTATAQEIGLPAHTRQLRPVELSVEDRDLYETAWAQFRDLHGLDVADVPEKDTSGALRRVQKASLLKAPKVAEIVAGLVEDGYQVVVPAWYLDNVSTLARLTAAALKARGLPDRVVEITGASRGLRELKRQAFQAGVALVAVVNSLEGINLHAGERGGAGKGKDATKTPRACVIADVLTGGKRSLQAEGRTQRDGERSLTLYVYAEGTTEQQWLSRMLRATAGTQALVQSPAEAQDLQDLADQLSSQQEEEEEAEPQ
ncbi:DEAD/DEAH box helicase family protein [Streptomyces anthocyanicus]|uniref:DEAD/DEAH box helicase family protein n=1 Tax=Streptomyces anthocyanicus TaxID=68174 RepID=UPI00380487F9